MGREYLELCYDNGDFTLENLMGPNCEMLLLELLEKLPKAGYTRILDLGCGTGLTSMLLAKKFEARIFAADLWINPAANYKRFKQFGLEKQIIPLYANANDLPFAEGYFDLVISIDSYHYFGARPGFLEESIAPLLCSGGIAAIVVPGLQKDFVNGVPEELQPFWQDDMNFYSSIWWKNLWMQSGITESIEAFSCKCHSAAWQDWLRCKNPYAQGDIKMMEAEGGKYFDTVGIIARIK